MAGDLQHIHDPAKAEEFARALGLQIGGGGHPFVGPWGTKGLYAYKSGKYSGIAYFGTRETVYAANLKRIVHGIDTDIESEKVSSMEPLRPRSRIFYKALVQTCFEEKYPSFDHYQNIMEFIQFKTLKLMGNHGSKITQGVFCISIMRIREEVPHGVWMTVLKTELMIGLEAVG